MIPAIAWAAWGVMAVVMAGFWVRQRFTGNAGVVDVVWSFATAVCGVVFAVALGDGARQWIIAGIAGVWGLRLGAHLWHRMSTDSEEDIRYRKLRTEWGGRFQLYLFGFFQLQALWAVLFALPMAWAAMHHGRLSVLDGLAVGIWLVGIAGEAVADRQLSRFRNRPGTRGQVCRDGLWRYSRHPNYFFEWLHWWAYPLLGLGGPAQWLTFLGPAVMLWFLTRVTGIPLLEQRMLESRGDAYRDYQRTTNAFFPGPPKEGLS